LLGLFGGASSNFYLIAMVAREIKNSGLLASMVGEEKEKKSSILGATDLVQTHLLCKLCKL
jgi:hypothetical protein